MSNYEDQVPFLNSPSSPQPGQGFQGSHDNENKDPFYEGSKSEDSMEDGGANDGPHHSRQGEVIEPTYLPAWNNNNRKIRVELDFKDIYTLQTMGSTAVWESQTNDTGNILAEFCILKKRKLCRSL